ncbi:MAG: phosphoribosyltransferase [Candidatus Hydrothermarchaeota archaeon]
MKYLRLSWEEIEAACRRLAEGIKERRLEFDIIVGVARGGLVPARILSDMLGNDELQTMRIKFYDAVGRTAERPKILYQPRLEVKGKRVLLVDDIADTGKSLTAAIDHLKGEGAGEVSVAVLAKRPSSSLIPDLCTMETDAWVIFPWEVQETARDILRRRGKGAREELEDAGIREEELVRL